MVKRDLKSGMRASMKLEEDATKARFDKAESVFASPEPPKPLAATVDRSKANRESSTKSPVRYVLQTYSVSQIEIDMLEQLKSVAAEEAFARKDAASAQAALGTNKSELVRIAVGLLGSLPSAKLLDLIVKTKSQAGQMSKGRRSSS